MVLMVIGAVEIIRWICFRLWRPSHGRLELVARPQGPEDCEDLVRAAAQRVEWMELDCTLVVETGKGTEEIVERLRGEYPWMEVRQIKDE